MRTTTTECRSCGDPATTDGLCRLCWIDQNVGTSPPVVRIECIVNNGSRATQSRCEVIAERVR